MSRSRRAHTKPRNAARPAQGPDRASLDALLDAFDRASTPQERAEIGAELATGGFGDDRVRAALVRMLDDDPLNAAAYLSALGDRRVVADLRRTLDRLLVTPIADCDVCHAEQLVALETALHLFGERISMMQLDRMEAAMTRAAGRWIPLEGHCGSESGATEANHPAARRAQVH